MGANVRQVNVAIIGSGLGGLGVAMRLKAEGDDSFVVIEKADAAGGTWRDNTYPGCCCDIPAMLYWYSLDYVPGDQQPDWTHVYPRREEIYQQIQKLIERRGLADHLLLGNEVTRARWVEDRWHIETSQSGTIAARHLVCAAGQLSRPVMAKIPGRESFTGPQFHSARWDHDVSLDGKRVIVIGTGASGLQIVPAIADQVASLVVVQRTANHILPRMDRAYSEEERAEFRDPERRRLVRLTCHEFHETLFRAFTTTGTHSDAQGLEDTCRQHLSSQVSDPDLRAKLWPNYTFGCKRPLFSDDYFPSLNLPHVQLTTSTPREIDAGGLRTDDGYHRADVIIHATGFDTQSFIGNLQLFGKDRPLRDAWKDFPQTFKGVMVSGFPNFFLLYGPNSGLSHNSVLLMLEAQIEFFLQCKDALERGGHRFLDVTPQAMAESMAFQKDTLSRLVWSTGCKSWYKNERGDVTTQWTGTVDEYRDTLKLDPDAMNFE